MYNSEKASIKILTMLQSLTLQSMSEWLVHDL